jgi:hypothetical protein
MRDERQELSRWALIYCLLSLVRFSPCWAPREGLTILKVRLWVGCFGLFLTASGCLSYRVASRFPDCRLERECGDLLGVDCDSAVDGPYWYVRKDDLSVVAGCGGLCMKGHCTNCPPKEWTCAVY